MKAVLRPGDAIILAMTVGLVLWLMADYVPRQFTHEVLMVHINSPKGDYLYPLEEDRLIDLSENGRRSIVEISGGRVRMREDNSPRQIAVQRGWIEKSGQWIVNLPHRIAITIEGGEDLIDSEVY